MEFQREAVKSFIESATLEQWAMYLFFQMLILAYVIAVGRWLLAGDHPKAD
jgi:hypothetical protein